MGERLGDESLLETPTYVLAIVLFGFQVAAMVFTFIMGKFKGFLRHRKRHGLLQAVTHMEEELMLVGFISLCLIALQQPLTSICVSATPQRADWTMLQHVYASDECSCCLEHTINVKPCVLRFAHCGNISAPFCNCDGQDAQCAARGYMPVAEALPAPAEGRRRRQMLAAGSPSMVGRPAGGWLAQAGGPDGAKLQARGRRALLGESEGLTPAALEDATCSGAVTVHGSCPQGEMPVVSFLALEQVHLLIFTVSVVHVLCGFALYFGALLRTQLQWAHWERRDDSHSRAVRRELERYYAKLDAGKAPGQGQEASKSPQRSPGSSGGSPASGRAEEVDLEKQEGVGPVAAGGGGAPRDERVAPPEPSVLPSADQLELTNASERINTDEGIWGGRRLTLPWFVENAKCLLLGQSPRVVSPDQYARLRASFLYTHKLGPKFAFLDFVQRSMEEDLSHVVGLSFEFWLLIIIFVLISGPWGFLMPLYMGCAAVLLLLTNGKLAKIIRSVTLRVFWFNRPPILLIPIKMALFICAFIYAWFIFAVWQFGVGSCPFTKAFYPGWTLPWWTILVFDTLILLHIGAVTLPTYSLAVQMGSDWKKDMLPKKLTKRLLAVAESTKQQLKAQEQAGGRGVHHRQRSRATTRAVAGGLPGTATGAPTERAGMVDRVVEGVVKHLVGEGEE